MISSDPANDRRKWSGHWFSTYRDAFAKLDAAEYLSRQCWSAASINKSIVVVTLWNYNRLWKNNCYSLEGEHREDGVLLEWVGRAGNSARKRHLAIARDHLGGLFYALLVDVEYVDAPRGISHSRQKGNSLLLLQDYFTLDDFDDISGEFRATRNSGQAL